MSALIYFDTGEIFEIDEEGDPVGEPVVIFQHPVLDDDAHALGLAMAAAPELLAHLEFAVKLLRPLMGSAAQVQAMEACLAKAKSEALDSQEPVNG